MSERVPRIRVPRFAEQDRLVAEALDAGHLAVGPHLDRLAEAIATMFDKRFVTLTANGFCALFATLRSTISRGEPVVTSPASTCFAIVNALKAADLPVQFVDMDPATMSIPVSQPAAELAGRARHAVVPDHFGVVPAMLAEPRTGGILVEDAAQAFLSRIRRQTHADVVVLSFYPTKTANGIDGGAVLTDDPVIHEAVRRTVSYVDQLEPDGQVRYNLRMNNINAAFALGTIPHLPCMEATLRRAHQRLAPAVQRAGLDVFDPGEDVPTRLIVLAPDEVTRDRLVLQLNGLGIEAARELVPVCSPAEAHRFPVMQSLVRRTFSLPFHAALTDGEMSRIEAMLERVA